MNVTNFDNIILVSRRNRRYHYLINTENNNNNQRYNRKTVIYLLIIESLGYNNKTLPDTNYSAPGLLYRYLYPEIAHIDTMTLCLSPKTYQCNGKSKPLKTKLSLNLVDLSTTSQLLFEELMLKCNDGSCTFSRTEKTNISLSQPHTMCQKYTRIRAFISVSIVNRFLSRIIESKLTGLTAAVKTRLKNVKLFPDILLPILSITIRKYTYRTTCVQNVSSYHDDSQKNDWFALLAQRAEISNFDLPSDNLRNEKTNICLYQLCFMYQAYARIRTLISEFITDRYRSINIRFNVVNTMTTVTILTILRYFNVKNSSRISNKSMQQSTRLNLVAGITRNRPKEKIA